MNIKFLFVPIVAIALLSCSHKVYRSSETGASGATDSIVGTSVQEDVSERTSAQKMIFANADNIDEGELLVKFVSAPSDSVLAATKVAGVAKIEKVFNTVPGKEEIHSQYGFDRWFCVELEEGANTNAVAEALAALDFVEAVQYSLLYKRTSDSVVRAVPAVAPAAVTAVDPAL